MKRERFGDYDIVESEGGNTGLVKGFWIVRRGTTHPVCGPYPTRETCQDRNRWALSAAPSMRQAAGQ